MAHGPCSSSPGRPGSQQTNFFSPGPAGTRSDIEISPMAYNSPANVPKKFDETFQTFPQEARRQPVRSRQSVAISIPAVEAREWLRFVRYPGHQETHPSSPGLKTWENGSTPKDEG